MSSTKKQRRLAAKNADVARIESELSGKSELNKLKTTRTTAKIKFTSKRNALLRSFEECRPGTDIQELWNSTELLFESYAANLSALVAVYGEHGDDDGQDRVSNELDEAEKVLTELNERYTSYLAEVRSTRSELSSRSRASSKHLEGGRSSRVHHGTSRHAETVRSDVMARHAEDVTNPNRRVRDDRLDLTSDVGGAHGGEHGDAELQREEQSESALRIVESGRQVPDPANSRAGSDVGRASGMEHAYSRLGSKAGETPSERDNLEQARRELDALYIKRHTEIKGRIAELTPNRAELPVTLPPITSHAHQKQLGTDMWKQLNRVAIPTFAGDKHSYAGWKAAFYTCVDAAPATPEYKLLQLRHYLKGDALKAIESLGHSGAAYEAAKERLERKFGGERRQIALRLEELDNFRPMRDGSAKEVDKFADVLDLLVINLREAGQNDEMGRGSLYIKLLKKLTEKMIADYKRWIDEHRKTEGVEVLREWIIREAEFKTVAAETLRGLGCRTQHSHTYYGDAGEEQNDEFSMNVKHDVDIPVTCPVCSEGHPVWKCASFKEMEVQSRWKEAKDKGLCFRCLASTHHGAKCPRWKVCGIDECRRSHSRLLHDGERKSSSKSADPDTGLNVNSSEYAHTAVGEGQSAVALRTIPVVIRNGGKSIAVNALLDDGSTRTYINTDVAAELDLLTGKSDEITVGTMGGARRTFPTEEVSFVLESADGRTCRSVKAFTATTVTGAMQAVEWRRLAPEWGHLKKLSFPKIGPKKTIDILIGLDHADLHAAVKEVHGQPGEPLARLTPLGWTCVGELGNRLHGGESTHSANLSYFVNGGMTEINRTLERFWEIEEPGSTTPLDFMSADEKKAYDIVTDSMKRSSEHSDKYQVAMPWKGDTSAIPSNIEAARKRLACTEKSLQKRKLGDTYKGVIAQYLAKGYIRKVAKDDTTGRWYLPHFAICRPDKSTTKTRIVFDASARHGGVCLNDFIHKGPKLQRDLNEVLLRFRKSPVAIACDVAEMYLQIELTPADRPFHRFLWRNMEARQADEYEFNRLVFGVNSCPFQAQLVTQRHAELNRVEFPEASDAVLHSTYMDDTMDSTTDAPSAIDLYQQLSNLWSSAGMHARKWISNSEEVLRAIPEEDRAKEIDLDSGQLPSIKTLGVLWKAAEDAFTFTSTAPDTAVKQTKRSFLSSIASLFDPIGMLAPFVIRAKILMQEVWLSGQDWDDELPDQLSKKISVWFEELKGVNNVRVPRCLRPGGEVVDTTLHFFCDASGDAYATVAYLRTTTTDNTVTLRQVTAKSKVAPVKAVSIPRLELLGATLSARAAPPIARNLEIDEKGVYYWSDSQNVLWWISKRSRSLKTFVANRIAKIQEVSDAPQWRYVPTKENPADLATRGMKMIDLASSSLWWEGPKFLTNDASTWPNNIATSVPSDAAKEEQKRAEETSFLVRKLKFEEESRLHPTHFSSLRRLVRVTAWVCRFADNCRRKEDERTVGELTTDELSDSEDSLVLTLQAAAFESEITALKAAKPIASSSSLIELQPFIDDDGLLRANTRLQHADYLSYEARHPVILPRRARVTKLIVRSYHQRDGHAMGTNHTLALLSDRFWVMKAREEIRETERECNACARRKAKAATQVMAPLPKCRLKMPLHAFSRTAVDYAGPFDAIQGRGRKRAKRYLCLFTCMVSRAVHLEMAFSLETNSFLNAFYRMTSRRGLPVEVLSDNGTNFVGAERELRELVDALDKSKIEKSAADKGIKWTFIPPLAPHFGGVHEAMIKSAKKAIYAVLGNADVNDEELMTTFTGAEDLINSRPITYQTANPEDDLPLTPNHFLHGRIGGEFAPSTVDTDDYNARIRWRRVQELVRHFWNRWLREWLPALARRKKWNDVRADIQIGNIVLVIEPNTPRGQWSIGRIEETFPGADGHVRSARVKMRGSSYVRPIAKLCPLELSE